MSDIDFDNLTTADLERLLDVPYVLWFCPKGCRGQVEWDKPAMIATCLVCGMKSSDERSQPNECPTTKTDPAGRETSGQGVV